MPHLQGPHRGTWTALHSPGAQGTHPLSDFTGEETAAQRADVSSPARWRSAARGSPFHPPLLGRRLHTLGHQSPPFTGAQASSPSQPLPWGRHQPPTQGWPSFTQSWENTAFSHITEMSFSTPRSRRREGESRESESHALALACSAETFPAPVPTRCPSARPGRLSRAESAPRPHTWPSGRLGFDGAGEPRCDGSEESQHSWAPALDPESPPAQCQPSSHGEPHARAPGTHTSSLGPSSAGPISLHLHPLLLAPPGL